MMKPIKTLVAFFLVIVMLTACNNDYTVNLEDSRNIAFDAILKEIQNSTGNNQNYDIFSGPYYPDKDEIIYLRTLQKADKSQYWVEFYALPKSALWIGTALVDKETLDVQDVQLQYQFYSGVSPEMALLWRVEETELLNEFGTFELMERGDMDDD